MLPAVLGLPVIAEGSLGFGNELLPDLLSVWGADLALGAGTTGFLVTAGAEAFGRGLGFAGAVLAFGVGAFALDLAAGALLVGAVVDFFPFLAVTSNSSSAI